VQAHGARSVFNHTFFCLSLNNYCNELAVSDGRLQSGGLPVLYPAKTIFAETESCRKNSTHTTKTEEVSAVSCQLRHWHQLEARHGCQPQVRRRLGGRARWQAQAGDLGQGHYGHYCGNVGLDELRCLAVV
jgi:hypothetical protein